MITLDTNGLECFGRSDDSTFYRIEDRIVAAVPDVGTRDNEQTARANVAFVNAHFRTHGPGALLVFIDALASQDRASRRTYQKGLDPEVILGAGLIGGSALGRAVGSAFLGLGGSTVPFKLFPSYATGLDWARRLVQELSRESA